jgi:hypothetical protein
MKHISLAAVLATVAVATLAATAHAEVTIIENNRTVDVDCAKDPEIALLGNHITITTQGVCASIAILGNHASVRGSSREVNVAGNHNTLSLVAADDVSVAGNHNTISVRKGVTRKTPRISNLGTDNRVTQPD